MPASTAPRVSVIVPNYNHAPFLRRRLDSILAQTFQDVEILILDDASTDGSAGVVAPYLADPRITFRANAKNSGSPFVQWNRGVAAARGELVWIAESDDFAAPTLLEKLVALVGSSSRVAVAYCQSWKVDPADVIDGTLDFYTADLDAKRWQHPFVNNGRDECGRFLVLKNTIPNASAVVFRREAFLRAGGAPLTLRLSGDWLAWVRILQFGDV